MSVNGMPHGKAAPAALPELSEINKAQLWLHYFRVLSDQGVPLKVAVRRADEFFGFEGA